MGVRRQAGPDDPRAAGRRSPGGGAQRQLQPPPQHPPPPDIAGAGLPSLREANSESLRVTSVLAHSGQAATVAPADTSRSNSR
jgi:hypothetical protein